MNKPIPNDKELYEKIKKEITNKYKPSAYRSGLLVKKYKEEYYKKHKSNNAYSGNREQSNLKRWFDEKWRSNTGEVGYKNKGDIYRPTIRINNKTPTTIHELTQSQINRAREEKKRTGRVKHFNV
jgi:hypothetical protein